MWWVGRRGWGTGVWEGLGAPFVLCGVSHFAFFVETDFDFGAMFPTFWVVGFGVCVLVPGGATFVRAVLVPGGVVASGVVASEV